MAINCSIAKFQIANGVVRTTFDLSLTQQRKPAFHLIDPRAVGQAEVQMIARMALQPLSDDRRLMGAVVIQESATSGKAGGLR